MSEIINAGPTRGLEVREPGWPGHRPAKDGTEEFTDRHRHGSDRRDAEILALRHQLLVLQRQVPRQFFDDTDRSVLGVLAQVFDRDRLGQVFLS